MKFTQNLCVMIALLGIASAPSVRASSDDDDYAELCVGPGAEQYEHQLFLQESLVDFNRAWNTVNAAWTRKSWAPFSFSGASEFTAGAIAHAKRSKICAAIKARIDAAAVAAAPPGDPAAQMLASNTPLIVSTSKGMFIGDILMVPSITIVSPWQPQFQNRPAAKNIALAKNQAPAPMPVALAKADTPPRSATAPAVAAAPAVATAAAVAAPAERLVADTADDNAETAHAEKPAKQKVAENDVNTDDDIKADIRAEPASTTDVALGPQVNNAPIGEPTKPELPARADGPPPTVATITPAPVMPTGDAVPAATTTADAVPTMAITREAATIANTADMPAAAMTNGGTAVMAAETTKNPL